MRRSISTKVPDSGRSDQRVSPVTWKSTIKPLPRRAAVTSGGEPAGTLTSPCESPTLGRVIGLAVLETKFASPGSRVEVALGDDTVTATVEPLPIYDSEKRRPRA